MRLTDEKVKDLITLKNHGAFGESNITVDMIDTIEALQQELDSLQKCYDVTNESWKQLKQDNEQLQAQNEQLQARLQISPYGDDKIDELEEAFENVKFQNEQLQAKYAKLNDFEQSQCAKLLTKALKRAKEILQDMVDVANVSGSAYLYKRDAGKVIEVIAAIDKAVGE